MKILKIQIQELLKFISKLSPKEKVIFYAACAVVSLLLLDRLIVSPVFYKIESLDSQIKEREGSARKNLRVLAQKDRIQAAGASYSAFSGNKFGSEDEEITAFLKEIEVMANKSSVYLIDIKPGNSKLTPQARKYLVNLNCEAQMEQVIDFMYAIENSSKLLTIERYQISSKSKDSSLSRCNIVVSKTFIQ